MLIWRRGCAFIIQVEFIKTGLDFHSKFSKQVWYFNAKFWIQISEIYSFTGISEIFEIKYLLNYRKYSCKFKYMSSNQICSEIYAIFQSLYFSQKSEAAKSDQNKIAHPLSPRSEPLCWASLLSLSDHYESPLPFSIRLIQQFSWYWTNQCQIPLDQLSTISITIIISLPAQWWEYYRYWPWPLDCHPFQW